MNKAELFHTYQTNILAKFKTILHNIIQTYMIMGEFYLCQDTVIEYSTNNVFYINLRKRIGSKL